MKVLLINGSPRKDGNTFVALSEIANTLEKEHIATEFFQLGSQPVRPCIACQQCVDKNRCIFNDDIVNRLIEKAEIADGFVFGTPTYYGQPVGTLQSAIQRALFAATPLFAYKPVASIVICRRGGATAAFQTMNMPFEMCNMPIVTSQYWNIAYGQTKGQAALDAEGMQTMRTMARNMAWILRHLAQKPHPDNQQESRVWTNFIRSEK